MRTSTIIFFFLLTVSRGFSQTYTPLPDSGAIWVNTYYQMVTQPPQPTFALTQVDNYCTDGRDTLINSLTYVQVHYCGGAYKGAFRNTGQQVMYVPKDSLQEFLLYDFGATTGTTLHNVYYDYSNMSGGQVADVFIAVVDSVLINGTYRTRLNTNNATYWIEGIGNTYGLFRESYVNVSGYELFLECMSHNGTTLYPSVQPGHCDLTVGIQSQDEQEQILYMYPNPTAGDLVITGIAAGSATRISLINMIGQSIDVPVKASGSSIEISLANVPAGIYTVMVNTMKGPFRQTVIKE
jgi:hypothetical protein